MEGLSAMIATLFHGVCFGAGNDVPVRLTLNLCYVGVYLPG
jgi:hypothetical protein